MLPAVQAEQVFVTLPKKLGYFDSDDPNCAPVGCKSTKYITEKEREDKNSLIRQSTSEI